MQKSSRYMSDRFDINNPKLLHLFKEAAAADSRRSLKTVESARATLIKEGIVTKSGRLTKNYSR